MSVTLEILIDPLAGFLRGARLRIHDRASLFSEQFRQLLRSARVDGAAPAGSFTELERVCGTVCMDDAAGVFGRSDMEMRKPLSYKRIKGFS